MKLTQASIARLRMPAGKSDHIEFDDSMPGFGIRIRAGANGEHRTFVAQYKLGDKHRRTNLGNTSKVTLDSARKHAQIIFGEVARGKDPAAETDAAKAQINLGAVITRYLQAKQSVLRERTYNGAVYQLHTLFKPLHNIPLASVSRATIAAEIGRIATDNGNVMANRSRSTLSAMFAWAIGEGLCDLNPVIGTNKREENDPRERTLSDSECATLLLATGDAPFEQIVKLLLFTGCRREEIGSLRWSEIDMDAKAITLPAERTKNGRPHVVPLSESALEVLQSVPRQDRDCLFGISGFSNWTGGRTDLERKVKLPHWTLHDLRRTVRTGLGKLDVAPHVAEAVLNHLPPKLIRTYDRNAYETEKRDALERWSSHLSVAVAQASGANVVKLGKTSQ